MVAFVDDSTLTVVTDSTLTVVLLVTAPLQLHSWWQYPLLLCCWQQFTSCFVDDSTQVVLLMVHFGCTVDDSTFVVVPLMPVHLWLYCWCHYTYGCTADASTTPMVVLLMLVYLWLYCSCQYTSCTVDDSTQVVYDSTHTVLLIVCLWLYCCWQYIVHLWLYCWWQYTYSCTVGGCTFIVAPLMMAHLYKKKV